MYGSKPPDMRMLQTMSLDETRALPLDRWGIPTPPEQWANVPAAGKWQFFVFIGILEALGECFPSGEHYMAGGRPGVYPSLTEPNDQMRACGLYPPHGFNVDLLPFRASLAKQDEAKRARGRQVEINNGRLAMLGLMGFLAESKLPGSVPALGGIALPYDGDYMAPFAADFHIF